MSDEARVPINDMITALERPFPTQAIKQRDGGGGRTFDYVETQTVIRRLNEATMNNWSYRITRFEWRGELLITTGELTIPGLGTRSGTGVQKVHERGGEDLVKGAASDGLKNCARMFGVGLDLYGPDLESGEVASPPPQQRRQTQRPPAQQTPPPAQAKRMTQLENRRIHEHAKKHGLWQQAIDHAHTTYQVADLSELTVDQGRELYRWISQQAQQAPPAPERPPLDPQLNPEGI